MSLAPQEPKTARPRSEATTAFEPSGFFAFRTPLLPFDTLVDWAHGVTANRFTGTEPLATAVSNDRAALIVRLRSIMSQPVVQEAIFIASPSTYSDTILWLKDVQSRNPHLERTLVRYLQRMAGRPTPFGLFAGCSTGVIGNRTRIEIAGREAYQRYSRIDNDCLYALAEHLANRDDIRKTRTYRPNSSLYQLAGKWRYIQTQLVGTKRHDTLVALDADEFLAAGISCARHGVTFAALVDQISERGASQDVSHEDAVAYVNDLIDTQVLVSDMSPLLTGGDPLTELVDQLRSSFSLAPITAALDDVRARLAKIDQSPLGIGIDAYRAIRSVITGIGVDPDPSKLFQVDLIKPSLEATCDHTVIDEMRRAVNVLQRLAPHRPDPLQRFREAFVARYDRREISLLEALDEDAGIGLELGSTRSTHDEPLLNTLPFGGFDGDAVSSWSSREALLLPMLEKVRADRSVVLHLTDRDVDRLARVPQHQLPDAFSVMASLSAKSGEASCDFELVIRGVGGPSGANALGRFCLADDDLCGKVRQHLDAEERRFGEAVLAEVVHLPEGRMGNVLVRPVLRKYEISYLGRSGAAEEQQIPVADLTVSIEDDEVVLRSRRLGVRVIPRMTTAHNYRRGHIIYRFLCTLQTQGVEGDGLGWSWGALEISSFLPRIVYGRTVLARARWRVGQEMIDKFQKGEAHEQFASVQEWRRAEGVPRFVMLADGDHELPVDCENVLSVETFIYIIRRRELVTIVEMYPTWDGLAASGREGRFVTEMIFPFIRTDVSARAAIRVRDGSPGIARRFLPGSSWLYLKWYTARSSVDSLLVGCVGDLVRNLDGVGGQPQWFFVRYGDPDWHIRLRCHCDGEEGRARLLEAAHAAVTQAVDDGRVWKVQIDTYEREVERYGGSVGVVLSEEIFWRDSEAVRDVVEWLPMSAGATERWRICLLSWDMFLSAFEINLDQKRRLAEEMRFGLSQRVGGNRTVDRVLGDKFRRERELLHELFSDTRSEGQLLQTPVSILRARSERLVPVMFKLNQLGMRASAWRSLAASHLHMHANRLLRADHAQQEFVMWDFLSRIYESQTARARGRGRWKARPGKPARRGMGSDA